MNTKIISCGPTKIISCGPDDSEPKTLNPNTEWCVYHYTVGSWEGDGIAYKYEDGKIYETNLGHCSCYGPWEDGWTEIDANELRMQLTNNDPNSQEEKLKIAILSVANDRLKAKLGYDEENISYIA